MATATKKALFVCLGNTCRSPIAEAVFKTILKEKGLSDQWEVDSAGLENWHYGDPPNSRSISILEKHNIEYDGTARQIENSDFLEFDYIFGMDEYNIRRLRNKQPKASSAKIFLLGDFDPHGDRIIDDPYCDVDIERFEKCFQQCERSCRGFLNKLELNI